MWRQEGNNPDPGYLDVQRIKREGSQMTEVQASAAGRMVKQH